MLLSRWAIDGAGGMTLISGGTFTRGSNRFYPEERPKRNVRVDAFWIDDAPVTNREFSAFARATGQVTFAEIAPDPRDYPGMPPELAQPGSLVFNKTRGQATWLICFECLRSNIPELRWPQSQRHAHAIHDLLHRIFQRVLEGFTKGGFICPMMTHQNIKEHKADAYQPPLRNIGWKIVDPLTH